MNVVSVNSQRLKRCWLNMSEIFGFLPKVCFLPSLSRELKKMQERGGSGEREKNVLEME